MAIKKYLDIKGWLVGLWDSTIPAGMTALLTLLGSNGVAATIGGPLADIGLNWKQALTQMGFHMLIAAATYLKAKPRPQVVEENIETTLTTKTTTTTTPKE